jgi:hypothetical protein
VKLQLGARATRWTCSAAASGAQRRRHSYERAGGRTRHLAPPTPARSEGPPRPPAESARDAVAPAARLGALDRQLLARLPPLLCLLLSGWLSSASFADPLAYQGHAFTGSVTGTTPAPGIRAPTAHRAVRGWQGRLRRGPVRQGDAWGEKGAASHRASACSAARRGPPEYHPRPRHQSVPPRNTQTQRTPGGARESAGAPGGGREARVLAEGTSRAGRPRNMGPPR